LFLRFRSFSTLGILGTFSGGYYYVESEIFSERTQRETVKAFQGDDAQVGRKVSD
jgi:hypothetical protein